jgi:hypothetical protein
MDKSWTAPETTAFKNVKPDDMPTGFQDKYTGQKVGTANGLPKHNYNYKGEKVGKEGGKPQMNSASNYKGANVGKKSK